MSDILTRLANLEREVAELRRIVGAGAQGVRIVGPAEAGPATEPLKPGPYVLPDSPDLPRPTFPGFGAIPARKCLSCGITLDQVMSYSCPHAGCPSGLGPTSVMGVSS